MGKQVFFLGGLSNSEKVFKELFVILVRHGTVALLSCKDCRKSFAELTSFPALQEKVGNASYGKTRTRRSSGKVLEVPAVRLEWLCTLTQNVPRAPHALFRGRPQASARRSLSNPEEPTVRS